MASIAPRQTSDARVDLRAPLGATNIANPSLVAGKLAMGALISVVNAVGGYLRTGTESAAVRRGSHGAGSEYTTTPQPVILGKAWKE